MKLLVFNALMLMSFALYSQETDWSAKEQKVLIDFKLNPKDHRGVIYSNTDDKCDISAKSLVESIETFFNSTEIKDLTVICIDESIYKNDDILNIRELVKLYLKSVNN